MIERYDFDTVFLATSFCRDLEGNEVKAVVDHKSVYVNDLGPVMSLDEIQDLYESYSK